VGNSLWIAVVVLGEIKNVFDACNAITEIVEGGEVLCYCVRDRRKVHITFCVLHCRG
jgi:hypothetical protein